MRRRPVVVIPMIHLLVSFSMLWLLFECSSAKGIITTTNPGVRREEDHNEYEKTEYRNSRPNVLIIMADQLNFRTLGCYRKQLALEQAFIWGDGVSLDTPFIDSLAAQGTLFTNFYTVSPTCTPSRASFLTGYYPYRTGAYDNNKPLRENITTFAHILQQHGYYTAYLGKWHLYGQAQPGWGIQQGNTFGFTNVTLQYNRGGASKVFVPSTINRDASSTNPPFDMYSFKDYIYSLNATGQDIANETTYLTDFLVQQTIDIISKHNETSPFAIMLSIPDPHPPYIVRSPYDTMYQHLHFKIPMTMEQTLRNYPQKPPRWAHPNHSLFTPDSSTLQKQQSIIQQQTQSRTNFTRFFKNQKALQRYFGMIKCLDDNVGKLLAFMDKSNYTRNTLIVFTSDHGGMVGEHALQTKGKPFKTSMGVPFIIKYPKDTPSAGKVIHTPTSNIDFSPTLLSILNITVMNSNQDLIHGQDLSLEWIHGLSSSNRTIFASSPRKKQGMDWVAAMDTHYKLVLSTREEPWLFDLIQDPDEMKNYYKDPTYHSVAKSMRQKLLAHVRQNIPLHIFDSNKIPLD